MSESEPEITDDIPTDTPENKEANEQLKELKQALSDTIPPKSLDSNLLIATWNIKFFGDLKEKWEDDEESPKRNLRALKYIAEIVSRFDVIAIQEVTGNLKALRHLMKALGSDWSLLMTDEVRGTRGNKERFVFLFDKRKISLSGLACELVIPTEEMKNPNDKDFKYPIDKQFARTPYAVGFTTFNQTFVLVTLHVIFGDEPSEENKERAQELLVISKWLSDWAVDINTWEHNLITLGDFNIDRKDEYLYDAFISGGLEIHPHFHDLPRTLKDVGEKPDKRNFYDQIAWFTGTDGKPALSLNFLKGGYFDFSKYVYKGMPNKQLEWRMSDHFPLWAEFELKPIEAPEIPTVDTSITAEMEAKKEEDAIIRKRLVLLFTNLENAAVVFINHIVEQDITITDDAERYFVNLLFRDVIIEKYDEMLRESDDAAEIPEARALDLAKAIVTLMKNEARDEVSLADLKQSIRDFDLWPFEKERVG